VNAEEAFVSQAETCASMGSPFTARLCRLLAENLRPSGMVADRVLNWASDPSGRADAVPLRLAGALHALVLEDRDPPLARVYPPHHDSASDADLWDTIAGAFERHPRFILSRLAWPPQTNEVMRSAALCPGFLTIADRLGLPLVTSELGASAGLNQVWDRFRYRFGDAAWGPENSPVTIAPDWSGPPPPCVEIKLLERAGCDRAPPDLREETDRLRLQSFVWADQAERMARMRAAMDLAAETGIQIIARDALDWLTDRLALRLQGSVHAVYHSLFWQYFNRFSQVSAVELFSEAGRRATAEAPLAWLRLEGDGLTPGGAILLTLWPEGETRLLGRADFHGRWVRWTGWT
jgi:hypothetical protein